MSLSVDGVWKVGVWAQTVWANGVWKEGSPVVIPTGAGDDDDDYHAGGRPVRMRTREDVRREYEQLASRIPPDLLPPAEKVMRRLGAKPVVRSAPIKGKDFAGPLLVGDIATNIAMQAMQDEEELMLLLTDL